MKAVKKSAYQAVKLPDKIVIERVLEGEKELFEILMRRYNQTLYRVIRSYLRVEKDIEDAMQDTYLKAFHKLHQFRSEATFSTWLIRIGINEALQSIRRKKNERIAGQQNEKVIQLHCDHMNPEKKAIQNERRVLIEKAIDALPQKYRIVYVLREVEEMSNSAVAHGLKLSESNVKVRLHRSKKMLKETLYKLSSEAELFEFGNSYCDKLVDKVLQKI